VLGKRQATAKFRPSAFKGRRSNFCESFHFNSILHALVPMAPLQYGAIVNIVTLVVFSIYLCISLYLIARQGLGRSMPWIWLTLLAVCRLTQVSLDLYATTTNPPDTAPNTSLGRRMQWILLMVHIPLVISFILIVAGGIDPDSRDGPTYHATEATKAGVTLYVACFLVLIWATTVISARLYLADKNEVKILTTVVLSLPFFVVDVVYMMCFAYESWFPEEYDAWLHMRFNVISGDVTTQLCM
jgi:hypothetical protein